MIKRTLYFGNPTRLSVQQQQLLIKTDEVERTVPIEDIGVVVIDHYQTSVTHAVFACLVGK
jgi:CRISPR-associated protein Cas1